MLRGGFKGSRVVGGAVSVLLGCGKSCGLGVWTYLVF